MSSEVSHPVKKRPPAALFALGHAGVPETLTAQGVTYRLVRLFKHDFFAATALYAAESGTPGDAGTGNLAVYKVQRTYPLWGLPMKWLGRIVAGHEIRIYRRLQGIQGVPTFLGQVGPTGFLHAYVPGRILTPDLPLTLAFFEQLRTLLEEVHARGIAYVDTNKRENILFGDDGRPWLIDFQISFGAWPWRGFLRRWLLRRLQNADWYHYYKHKTRLLPQYATPEDFARAQRRGRLHRLHRAVATPLTRLRRWYLSRYDLANTK